MRILRASDRALLVEAADLAEAMRMNRAWEQVPGIIERIPAARTVLVRFDPAQVSAASLAAVLEATETDAAHESRKHEVVIPVRYDGEDLAEVAALLGVSPEELVTRHLAAHWEVAFSGFAPGFGYLVGDDPMFQVPRRLSPRTRVPAGAVALAGEFTGVYPRESPGGWQLIGRTDAVMWAIDREPPALLAPGVSVRFERVGERLRLAETRTERASASRSVAQPVSAPAASLPPLNAPRAENLGSLSERSETKRGERAAGESKPHRAVEIVRPSLQLLVQDAGRPGHAALGVSASGAADRRALRDANRAVGNAPGSAVVESVGGVVLRFRGAGVAVVTGAIGALSLVDAAGPRTAVHGVPFATADGDELTLGHPTNGLRYMIGVRGGVDVASALGSRASDTLAGLGPAALLSGDSIPIGSTRRGVVEPMAAERMLPAPGDLVELQITLGPRDDWFTAKARATLTEQEWLVTSRSDRVGMRLQGDVPLERSILSELPSEGAVTGAIQVPPDGQPVLFLPDHPLTGGYPIIGAVTDRCLDLAGQLPPGVRIRFRV